MNVMNGHEATLRMCAINRRTKKKGASGKRSKEEKGEKGHFANRRSSGKDQNLVLFPGFYVCHARVGTKMAPPRNSSFEIDRRHREERRVRLLCREGGHAVRGKGMAVSGNIKTTGDRFSADRGTGRYVVS